MRVEWSEPAIADLDAIRAYIARDSEYYAARFVHQVVKTAKMLEAFPELGQVIPECHERIVRERIVHNYRILYEVRQGRILIITIVHAARNLGASTCEL